METPATADQLVRLLRGKPWDVDYGRNPGLTFPVGIEDRPRQHRQDVHTLDLLGANALVIGGPQSGVTTTLATMMTTAALMYRPERVQFYCVAAGGPSLAAVAGLPHVAGLAPAVDREGVGRIIASVQGIVAEREAVFAKTGLDMEEVRRRKFSDKPEPVPVAGGDIVLVIDGWGTFATEFPQYVDHIVALGRSLGYGIHLVVSHTSYLQGFKQALKPLATERIELRLTDPGDSEMNRQLAKKVPRGVPGRGLTKPGMHLLIGVPELGERPDGRVTTRDIGPLIAEVSGVQKAATVSRLPESVPFEEVQRLAQPVTRRTPCPVRPFGGRPRTRLHRYRRSPACDRGRCTAVGTHATSCGSCAGPSPPSTVRKKPRSWCSTRVGHCSVWCRVRICATTRTRRPPSAKRSAISLLSSRVVSLLPARRRRR